MKKNFAVALLISIIPSLCFGASARYTQLVREKQRKYDELQKCLGATKGLKIAGVSTLGLTAVGVSTNIAQSETKKSYDKKLERADEKLNNIKKQIDNKDTTSSQAGNKNSGLTIKQAVENDIKNINNSDAKPGSTVVLNGYKYKDLPTELSIDVKVAVDDWVKRCEGWEGKDGIQTIETYNGATNNTLDKLTADNETTNETDTIAACNLAQENGCVEKYTQNGNVCVAITDTSAQTSITTDNTAAKEVVETQDEEDDEKGKTSASKINDENTEAKFDPTDPGKSLNDIAGKLIDLDNPGNGE